MKKAFVFVILALVLFGSCSNKQNIEGTWVDSKGRIWAFYSDGKMTIDDNDGWVKETTYSVAEKKLQLLGEYNHGRGQFEEMSVIYDISLSGDGKTLILSNASRNAGDLWPSYGESGHSLTKIELDKKLNGTWVGDFKEDGEEWKEELKYNNGNYESIVDGVPSIKGTYTTNGGKITTRVTHYYSEDDSEWLEDDGAFTEGYQIEGKTLTLKGEEGEYKFTKK